MTEIELSLDKVDKTGCSMTTLVDILTYYNI